MGAGYRLPVDASEFDIIYLYSVFSHMDVADVRAYLGMFPGLMAESGVVFLTAFLEDDVPDVTINPEGYRARWEGPLHCVRYNRGFFESMALDSGLVVRRMDYETETDGQSALYLSRAGREGMR